MRDGHLLVVLALTYFECVKASRTFDAEQSLYKGRAELLALQLNGLRTADSLVQISIDLKSGGLSSHLMQLLLFGGQLPLTFLACTIVRLQNSHMPQLLIHVKVLFR